MPKPWRLSPSAEDTLTEITLWTIENFGQRQADRYIETLLLRCQEIADGHAFIRTAARFSENFGDAEILIAKAESHFAVFQDLEDEIVVFDFFHERSDLPQRLRALINRAKG